MASTNLSNEQQKSYQNKEGSEMPQKPEQANSSPQQAQPASATSAGATASRPGAAPPGTTTRTGGSMPSGKVLSSDKRQFIIAQRRMGGMMQPIGLQPLGFDFVEQALRSSPDVEVMDSLGPKGLVGTLADGMGGAPNVLVAKMGDDKAEILKQQSRGQFIVERDQPLHLTLYDAQEPEMVMGTAPAGGTVLDTVIMVLGKENAPVRDAEVHLYGGMLPVSGITDERGLVTLSIIGEPVQSVRGLYVKPKSDYWTFYQADPVLDTSQANIVFLRALSDSFPEFPRRQTFGWGQRIMRLDQLPGNYRGQGVKIGIVDSGIATTHQDLQTIRLGFDISNKKTNPATWSQDTVSHGSHCAGVIVGADTGIGIRGFAPDAEVHACKLFPGGQISQLIDALEYCIEKQIDVVNLSLDAMEPSEVLEQQILRAKRLGVACIVAAGNSGGAVQYPASSPNVLAVAAIGRLGEFPADSYHTQTVGGVNGGAFFSPKFTCFGPEVAVCAPGVAILSSVPPNNYAVWDGTSMAASHVTGLAALVLAHHPDFQGPFKPRNSIRVDRLFQILKSGVQPVNVGDPRRTGFGLPDVLVALGLAPRTAMMSAPAGLFGNFPQFAPAALYGGGLGAFAFGPTGFAFGPSPYHQPQVPVGMW